ncbi:MAG: polysaccharide export protein [Bacteroidales bacterium]|nr:polysaccharide export protein [Bacteroidales bacterium]
MRLFFNLLLPALFWGLCACTTPRNVAYFQNAEEICGMARQQEQRFRLRPEDKINIIVNSSDPMLMQQFNLVSTSPASRSLGASATPRTVSGGSSVGGGQLLAYTVDGQGDINFPVLGRVAVAGKTRMEVAEYIRERLIARDLVKDPVVTVEYVNLGVLVLGEVARPGRVDILDDHFTILDAIAAAGDLTIIGLRENVMVSREVDGEDQTYFINLCDRKAVLESPAYYLQQNDVIYVTPNPKRQREFRAVGNAFSQPATWISITSLLTTLILLLR